MTLRLAVAIGGDAAGLREGVDAAGRQIDRLAERGQRMARRLADALNRGGRRMRQIGQRLALAVTAPLVAIGTVAVRAFDVQIQAERRLGAAIRATGEDATAQLGIFKQIASTLQSITTVGDETTLANIQVARSMGLNAQASARAARNAIALSDAFGINERSAIRYTAALEQGDTTMLNRYIPTLRNLEDETERAAEAQRILEEALELSIESARTGLGPLRQLGNSIGDLGEQFGQIILEGINPLIERARSLVDWLLDLEESTRRWIVVVSGIAAAIAPGLIALGLFTQVLAFAVRGLGIALAGFIAFCGGVRRVVRAIMIEIGLLAAAFASPVGAAIAMSTAVVAAVVGLRDTLAQIWQEIVTAASDWLNEQFHTRVAQPFVERFNRIRTALGFEPIELPPLLTTGEAERAIDEIDGKVAQLRGKLGEIQDELRAVGEDEQRRGFLNLKGEGLVLDIQELERRRQALAAVVPEGGTAGTPSSRISEAFRADMERVKAEFSGILDGIRGLVPEGLFNAVFGDIDTVTPDIEDAKRRLAELMAELPQGGVPGALAGNGEGGTASLSQLSEELERLSGQVGELPPQIEGVRDEVRGLGRDIAQGITGPLRSALQSGEQGFASFRDAGIRIMTNLRDRLLTEIFKPIEDAIAKLFSQAGTAGGGGGGGFFGGIASALSGVVGAIFGGGLGGGVTTQASNPFNAPLTTSTGSIALPFAMGGAFDRLGQVRTFAQGGAFDRLGEVITSPAPFRFANGAGFSQGLAGEAGPEAILPLRRLGSGRLGVEAAGAAPPAQLSIGGDTIVLQDSQTRPDELRRILAERDAELKRAVIEALIELNNDNPRVLST